MVLLRGAEGLGALAAEDCEDPGTVRSVRWTWRRLEAVDFAREGWSGGM